MIQNLETYNQNLSFLKKHCILIASGTNKTTFCIKNRDIVFKLYKNKSYLENEKMIYQTLVKHKINFFVPKTKFINNFISISQFASPVIYKNLQVNCYPFNYNLDIMLGKEKILDYNPIETEIWKNVCNEVEDRAGQLPLYNWGYRKNKILLLDFETILVDSAIKFLKNCSNLQKFKNSILIK